MNFLHARNKIVADRSGYNFEVNLGGLTNSEQISLAPSKIDRPDDPISVVTMIHEAMHAGNDDVSDKGYISIDPETFKGLATDVKLTNAAHFEVVPRRILGTDLSFAGETFTPSGGGGAPARTPREQAIRGASETFREAWTLGLNLHKLWVGLLRTPTEWNTLDLDSRFDGVDAGLKFSDVLPFWSKVMKLTIHSRGSINPVGRDPGDQPGDDRGRRALRGRDAQALPLHEGRAQEGGGCDHVPQRQGDRRRARRGDDGARPSATC